MAEAQRAKRFQVHLSTAVVLMCAAGGLIWANMRARHIETVGRYIKLSAEPLPATPESEARDKAMKEANPGIIIHPSYGLEILNGTETEFWNCATRDMWCGNRSYYYGWPSDALYHSMTVMITERSVKTDVTKELAEEYFEFGKFHPAPMKVWNDGAIVVNATAAIALLAAVWFGCERWIRWRAARKDA